MVTELEEHITKTGNTIIIGFFMPTTVLSLSASCRRNSPAEKVAISSAVFLAGDHLVKHNGHFTLSLSCLNLIKSR